ncbi:hypothetical protein FB451DRAFT_1172312 [Mycena latifolia]|nr:hypothetical protein FB451DRAFT_1172312 [Mycena latifolia]
MTSPVQMEISCPSSPEPVSRTDSTHSGSGSGRRWTPLNRPGPGERAIIDSVARVSPCTIALPDDGPPPSLSLLFSVGFYPPPLERRHDSYCVSLAAFLAKTYDSSLQQPMSGWVRPSLVAAFGVLPPHGGVASATGRRFGGPDRGAGIWPGLATTSGSLSSSHFTGYPEKEKWEKSPRKEGIQRDLI